MGAFSSAVPAKRARSNVFISSSSAQREILWLLRKENSGPAKVPHFFSHRFSALR